mgnify:CR=1 FL=1
MVKISLPDFQILEKLALNNSKVSELKKHGNHNKFSFDLRKASCLQTLRLNFGVV